MGDQQLGPPFASFRRVRNAARRPDLCQKMAIFRPLPPTTRKPSSHRLDSADDEDRIWFETVYQGNTTRQLSLRAIISGMAIGAVMSISNSVRSGLQDRLGPWASQSTACIIAYAVFSRLGRSSFLSYRRRPVHDSGKLHDVERGERRRLHVEQQAWCRRFRRGPLPNDRPPARLVGDDVRGWLRFSVLGVFISAIPAQAAIEVNDGKASLSIGHRHRRNAASRCTPLACGSHWPKKTRALLVSRNRAVRWWLSGVRVCLKWPSWLGRRSGSQVAGERSSDAVAACRSSFRSAPRSVATDHVSAGDYALELGSLAHHGRGWRRSSAFASGVSLLLGAILYYGISWGPLRSSNGWAADRLSGPRQLDPLARHGDDARLVAFGLCACGGGLCCGLFSGLAASVRRQKRDDSTIHAGGDRSASELGLLLGTLYFAKRFRLHRTRPLVYFDIP